MHQGQVVLYAGDVRRFLPLALTFVPARRREERSLSAEKTFLGENRGRNTEMDLIMTLALVAGAVFLENVWYDCRRERLQALAEGLRRAEAPRWVQRVGGIVGIGLCVL